MRILYAIQGTGNGHVSRAREIVPLLASKAEVDVCISGRDHQVDLPFPVKYSYQGFGFVFGKDGGIDYWQSIKQVNLFVLMQEIREVPVQDYDLIINDFEPVTAWAAKLRKVPCVSLSHQAAVLHPSTPKVEGFHWFPKMVLKNYAPTQKQYGFHFKAYGNEIFTPVIRHLIREAKPTQGNHYTVYLPSYSEDHIIEVLGNVNAKWEVFSKHSKEDHRVGNIVFKPVDQENFVQSLASSQGFFCGAGFEGPAEALWLGKKVAVIPMKGQYEQHLNAAAIHEFGVPVFSELNEDIIPELTKWVEDPNTTEVDFPDQTSAILDRVLEESSPLIHQVAFSS